MFVVSEAEAAVIRDIFHERGELAAAAELRRLFPGITDAEQARESARTIAGWRPLAGKPPPGPGVTTAAVAFFFARHRC
jgi:hypothetical protein